MYFVHRFQFHSATHITQGQVCICRRRSKILRCCWRFLINSSIISAWLISIADWLIFIVFLKNWIGNGCPIFFWINDWNSSFQKSCCRDLVNVYQERVNNFRERFAVKMLMWIVFWRHKIYFHLHGLDLGCRLLVHHVDMISLSVKKEFFYKRKIGKTM